MLFLEIFNIMNMMMNVNPNGHTIVKERTKSISLLVEPKHCHSEARCPKGSVCVDGFCFWQHCLLPNQIKGIK